MKERIGFASYPDFSGNSKALFEDMNNKEGNYELIWFCKDKKNADRLNKIGITAICDKDDNFIEEFNKTKIIINTHDYFMDIKKDNQIFINLWHGLEPKKAGVFSDAEVEWNYIFSTKNDFMVATSEFGRMIFSSVFNIPLYRIKKFSQARYKWLFENKGKRNLEKLLKINVNKFDKIIMYTPTFKKGIGKEDAKINDKNILNLLEYDESILIEYLKKNNILLILKFHPSEENKVKSSYSDNIVILKDEIMIENFITINEVLDAVDLLISDYSSIYIDYINLERPVLFFGYDKDEYINNRGILFDDLDFWWQAGPEVKTITEFLDESNKLINNENYYKKEREQFNRLVNGYKNKSNDDLIRFIYSIKNNDLQINNSYKMALLNKQNEQLKDKVKELENKNDLLQNDYNIVNQELDSIKYSRSYKFITKIKKIIKR